MCPTHTKVYFPDAYRYLIFYHILYFRRIAILSPQFILLTHCNTLAFAILSHLIFTTNTVIFYHILYVLRIPILVTTFYICDAYRYFLPHFIFPTHNDTSYHILYFQSIPILPTTFYIFVIPMLRTTFYILFQTHTAYALEI